MDIRSVATLAMFVLPLLAAPLPTLLDGRRVPGYNTVKSRMNECQPCKNFVQSARPRPLPFESIRFWRYYENIDSIAFSDHPNVYLAPKFFWLTQKPPSVSQLSDLAGFKNYFGLRRDIDPETLAAVILLHEYLHHVGLIPDDGNCPATNYLVTLAVLTHCFPEYLDPAAARKAEQEFRAMCKCQGRAKQHCNLVEKHLFCHRPGITEKKLREAPPARTTRKG